MEAKKYKFKRINNHCVVLGNDYSRIEELLPDVQDDLNHNHFNGIIIFDMLLSNGNTSKRFFESYFDGHKFHKIENHTPDLFMIKSTTEYFINHIELFKNSVLSKREIETLRGFL